MRTVTAKVIAQMNEYCMLTPEDFESGSGEKLANQLSFYHQPLPGYAVVGEATITMTLHDKDQLIDAKVDSLKEALNKEVADSHVRQTKLREQIQSLLAISYKPEVEA